MYIKEQRSNFSQFSDGLWLVAEHGGTNLPFEVEKSELLGFANNLIDIAIDCLRKSEKDTENEDACLCEIMEKINIMEKGCGRVCKACLYFYEFYEFYEDDDEEFSQTEGMCSYHLDIVNKTGTCDCWTEKLTYKQENE